MLNVLFLLLAGILGILTANLIEIDKLNQASDGNINLKKYLQKNWAKMSLSLCMVIAGIICRNYVANLQATGKSLALGVFCIGMAGPMAAEFILTKIRAFLQSATGALKPPSPDNP